MRPQEIVDKLYQQVGIDINTPTLAHWENYGLLPEIARSKTNRKVYSEDNLERVKQIAFLTQIMGLKLKSVKQYLDGDMALRDEVMKKFEAVETKLLPYGKVLLGVGERGDE